MKHDPKRWLVTAGLLLLLCAPAWAGKGGNGGGKPGGGDPPAPDPAIAYTKNGDLFVMNADGTNQTLVLAGADAGRPSWSPRRDQLAFQATVDGVEGLYVIDATSYDLQLLLALDPTTPSVDPAWSPELDASGSTRIAFEDRTPNGSGGNDYAVYLIDPAGGTPEQLTPPSNAAGLGISWAPGGDAIAVAENWLGSPSDLVVYDLSWSGGQASVTGSTNLTASSSTIGDLGISAPAWSNGGDRIVVATYSSGPMDVWVVDLSDPDNPVNVTDSADREERFPTWSEDDTQLALFAGKVGRNGGLRSKGVYVMAATGGSQTLLAKDGFHPDWRR